MKFKTLFQVLTLLALVFSVFGARQPAQAAPAAVAEIVSYDMTAWNAVYSGMVSDLRYEKWAFNLEQTTRFVATATPTSGNLLPAISLLDVNGNEISTLAGSLEATQPAGKYYLLIMPESGSGAYNLTLRVATDALSASVVADAASVTVDDSVLVRVKLNNVPASGLTSAEFACAYDPALLDVSGMSDVGLFGADAAMVISGPANGKFIVALAGSNGRRATTSGDAFVFYATGLQIGQTSIECAARVSKGDQTLTAISSTPAALNVNGLTGNILGKVNASKPVRVCAYDAGNVETCADADNGVFNMNFSAGNYKLVASAEGFLKAEDASVAVAAGQETLMPQITLLAGDIDGNNVIDQFDAMTIGMSYNAAAPTAADLNNDGVINVLDLEALAANYRAAGPIAW